MSRGRRLCIFGIAMRQPDSKLDFALHLDFSSILTNPILDIAARLWEEDRYNAFQICYRSMRRIDDLVDHRREDQTPISPAELGSIKRSLTEWTQTALSGKSTDPFTRQFLDTLAKYRIPFWPWERLCTAMIYDLTHNGFSSFHQFLRYCEGAAISPAAVFMHLCGVRLKEDGNLPPAYDIRAAARPLAVFSYLVHIMRDFEKDQRAGLNYFADDLLRTAGLTPETLRDLAVNRTDSPKLRRLMTEYVRIASYYRRLARGTIDRTLRLMPPRYQLSLELIYSLYHQIFERLDPAHGQFTTEATNPAPTEVQARIQMTIKGFRAVE